VAALRCKYEYFRSFGAPTHRWSVVGPKGGLHLRITDYGERANRLGPRYDSGLEVHWRTPLWSTRDEAPIADHCWLLQCPCWHDGSSLIATEKWIPKWLADPHNHDAIFEELSRALREEEVRQAGRE